jgi:hypothetical protein
MDSVAVLAYEGVSTFGLGVTAEVFGCDRSGEGLPRYDYAVTAAEPGLIRTDVGLPILVEAGLDRLRSADLAIAPPPTGSTPTSSPAATRGSRSTRTCSTSTRAT